MPEFGQNFRTQIVVGLKAEGVGEGEKLRQELMRLEVEMLRLQAEFGTGTKDLREYMAAYPDLARQISFASTRLKAFEDQISQPSDALERKAMAQAAAVDKTTAAVRKSSDEINALLDKEVAEQAAAAERKAAIEAQHEAELDQGLKKHLEVMARSEAADEKATQKQIADAEKAIAAVAKLSNETNALLDKEAAATEATVARERAARAKAEAQDEAEMLRHEKTHDQMLVREEAAEEERVRHRQEILDRIRRAEANQTVIGSFGAAIAGVNREQEHLNDLLEEGVRTEREATAAHAGMARAAAVEAVELERLGGATVTHVTAADSATRAVNRLTREEQELQSALLDVQLAIRRGGVSAFLDLDGAMVKGGRSSVLTAQQLDQSKSSSERAAYGILHLAHAFQDLQYGFGAVLNNIPLVVQALGGGPGLGGILMATGVAFEMLKGRLGDVGVALGLAIDPMQGFARTADELKAKLTALEGKHFKVQMDYTEIERATKALKEHEAARAAFEAGKVTKAQTALAEEAKKVADAAGGTPELSAVILGAAKAQGMSFAPQSDIDREKAIRTRMIPALKKQVAESGNAFTRTFNEYHLAEWETKLQAVQQSIQQADIDFATGMAGRFAEGKEDAIRTVKGLAERQPQAFKPDARRRLKELPETAEEKEWKDLAEEADKFIEEQVKEGKKLVEQQAEARRRADEALIAGHAAAFGGKKALAGKIEAETKRLVAAGEKGAARLQAAARAIAEADIRESKFVPEDFIPAVAAKVAEPHVEKAVAETIAGAAPGQGMVEAAKAAIAAEEAKAKAKVEKPEIADEVARIGREANEGIYDSILAWASENYSVAQIRKGMLGPMTEKMKDAKVKPELAPDVATKIFEEQLGKVRARLVGRGGVNAQTARAELGERQVKAIGQEQGRERRVERVQDVARRPAIAQEIMFRSGGMASPEQAEHGAEQYQSLINRGVAPPVAANRVMAELSRMIQQQRAIMDQTNAMMNGMANMLGQANQHLGMVGAQQGMMRGQMNQHRWVKPAPWSTIPGG